MELATYMTDVFFVRKIFLEAINYIKFIEEATKFFSYSTSSS